jgi:hypothetical protein
MPDLDPRGPTGSAPRTTCADPTFSALRCATSALARPTLLDIASTAWPAILLESLRHG